MVRAAAANGENAGRKSTLVFFGEAEALEGLVSSSVALGVECEARVDRIDMLLGSTAGIKDDQKEVTIVARTDSPPSERLTNPAVALRQLYESASGIEAIRRRISAPSVDRGELSRSLSMGLLITLYDLLALGDSAAAALLRRHYEDIAARLIPRLPFPGFDASLDPFINAEILRYKKDDVEHVIARDLLRTLVAEAGTSNDGLLLQLVVYFELESSGTVYNVRSELFRARTLPLKPTTRLCDALFDRTVALQERLLVGFGMAEHLVANEKSDDALVEFTRLLACRIGRFGCDENAMIAFQTSYRICRGLWSKPLFSKTAIRLAEPANDAVNLGLLEAIASRNASASAAAGSKHTTIRRRDVLILNRLDAFFVAAGRRGDKQGRVDYGPMMAYDILWQYGLVRARGACEQLVKLGKTRRWNDAAAYVRSDLINNVPKGLRRVWQRMRSAFETVLNATPDELRREALPQRNTRSRLSTAR
jgi:hypothetical protein